MNTPKTLTALTADTLAQTLPAECLDHLKGALSSKVYLIFDCEKSFSWAAFSSVPAIQEAVPALAERSDPIEALAQSGYTVLGFNLDPGLPTDTIYVYQWWAGPPNRLAGPIVTNDFAEFRRAVDFFDEGPHELDLDLCECKVDQVTQGFVASITEDLITAAEANEAPQEDLRSYFIRELRDAGIQSGDADWVQALKLRVAAKGFGVWKKAFHFLRAGQAYQVWAGPQTDIALCGDDVIQIATDVLYQQPAELALAGKAGVRC